ncbi:hypothetical protein [Mesorhizobium sp. KR1-2]|uniref:hypothetical protein n=1 Tax=Mesorhizobium sp. KR1-2 TaxID=3156609 RepID=UPI0032B33383
MRSDFAAVRLHLENAQQCLKGDDAASRKLRQALDLLVEVALTAEYTVPKGKVLIFPHRASAPR